MASTAKPRRPLADKGGLTGHPPGLSTLFFTELWERFSYYGMRSILMLFMVAPAMKGGLGFDTAKAGMIYGWYTGLVYMAGLPGGLMADLLLGHRNAVLIGGILIAMGHFTMAFKSVSSFYAGLLLIILGTGLLKPNVSGMVGGLYEKNDPRRDSGFSIFYMGINLGAFLSPFVCGTLGQKINWHWGFAAAGFGMTLGLIQYIAGRKRLGDVGLRPNDSRPKTEPVDSPRFSAVDAKRLAAVGILFVFSAIFWAAFEQAGSSLNLFADQFTRTSILGWEFPSSWFQSVNAIFIILLAPVFAWLWLRLGKHEPSSPAKFAYGLFFAGLGFLVMVAASQASGSEHARVSPLWLMVVYLLHTIGELCLSPVGLSTFTKLAPARVVGLMMGVWFVSLFLGNKIGGWIAGFFGSIPLTTLFGRVAIVTIGSALLLALLVKPIRNLMGGVH